MTAGWDDAAIDAFVRGRFALFDARAPAAAFLARLVDDVLEMYYPPDGHIADKDGFVKWLTSAYDAFPRTKHTPKQISIVATSEDQAQLQVVVNWQADRPAAGATPPEHLNFDACQSWTLWCRDDGLLIKSCLVESLEPR